MNDEARKPNTNTIVAKPVAPQGKTFSQLMTSKPANPFPWQPGPGPDIDTLLHAFSS